MDRNLPVVSGNIIYFSPVGEDFCQTRDVFVFLRNQDFERFAEILLFVLHDGEKVVRFIEFWETTAEQITLHVIK